jgi:hypothetical protein
MRSAAVILTQHRRSCRTTAPRYERAQSRRIVVTRSNFRRDFGNESRNATRALPRPGSGHVRAVRRRARPDVLMPRGFLPLVVH